MFDDPSKAPNPPVEVDQATARQIVDAMQTMTQVAAGLSESRQSSYQAPPPPPTIKYFPQRVSAGGGAAVLYETNGIDMDLDRLASELLKIPRRRIRLFRIRGDSMFPTLAERDIVVVDAGEPSAGSEPLEGEIYIVAIQGEIYAKRARWPEMGVLHWCSDNDLPEYAPIPVTGEDLNRVKVLGKVVWLWRPV